MNDTAAADSPTLRDLARIGVAFDDDGRAFKIALHSFTLREPVDSPESIEMVAGQVYSETAADTTEAQQFAETMLALYDFDSLADVNAILGRENFEKTNYDGQLAFAAQEVADE